MEKAADFIELAELIESAKSVESKTDFEKRLFIHDSKHYTNHFIVGSAEEVDEIAYKILLEEKEYNKYSFTKLDEIEDNITQEYIDNCPYEDVKGELMTKRIRNLNNIKETKNHNLVVDAFNLIEKQENKSGAYNLLSDFNIEVELKRFNN